MKTQIYNIVLLILVMVAYQLPVKAEQVKKTHKSWPVKKVNSLAIDNKFGNINFLNNREDSVTIDVVIETNNESHRKGNSIADLIDFKFSFEDGEIDAQTIFNDKFKTNQDFTIIYTINIPVNKRLNVTNKFGNVTLNDLKANGKFEISYGNIFGNSIESLPDGKIDIDLKYSNATFESINRLKAQISFSKFTTGSIDSAEMKTRYSTINVDNCKILNSDSQYDNFVIGNLQSIKTDSKFTDWKIKEIVTDVEFEIEYGDVKVGHVSKNFQTVKIENRYGNVKIGIDKDASYNLKSDTHYCEVKHPKTSPTKYIKDNNHIIIEAIIGNNSPTSKVFIESKFGKVDLIE